MNSLVTIILLARTAYAYQTPYPGEYVLEVCGSKHCRKNGSHKLSSILNDMANTRAVINECGCLGACGDGVNIIVPSNGRIYSQLKSPASIAAVCEIELGLCVPDAVVDAYSIALNAEQTSEKFSKCQYEKALDIMKPYFTDFPSVETTLRIGLARALSAAACNTVTDEESRSMHNRAALSALAAVRIEQHNARSWWAFRDALTATHRNPWRVLVALSGILKYVDDRGESSTFARNTATKEIDDLCKLDSCCIHPACVSKSVPP